MPSETANRNVCVIAGGRIVKPAAGSELKSGTFDYFASEGAAHRGTQPLKLQDTFMAGKPVSAFAAARP